MSSLRRSLDKAKAHRHQDSIRKQFLSTGRAGGRVAKKGRSVSCWRMWGKQEGKGERAGEGERGR